MRIDFGERIVWYLLLLGILKDRAKNRMRRADPQIAKFLFFKIKICDWVGCCEGFFCEGMI